MITDLEACYDWQLYNIGSIVEESIRIDQNRMKLIVKVLLRMKHYICTRFGISSVLYSNKRQQIEGTGQENRFSGDTSRDISCFVIKEVEVKELGAIVELPISEECEQRAAITFVDDTNFYSNRQ